MQHKFPNKPEDAITRILEKHEYASDKLEAFIDASAMFTLVTSPTLQHRIIPDPEKVDEYRRSYFNELNNATTFLQSCKLNSDEQRVLGYAVRQITSNLNIDNRKRRVEPDL